MGSKEFLEKSKQIVVDYFNSHADKTDQKQITQDDVYVVWYCKTLHPLSDWGYFTGSREE